MTKILKSIVPILALFFSCGPIDARTTDILHIANTIEIYHLSRYTTSILDLSPKDLRKTAGWHFTYRLNHLNFLEKDWDELVILNETKASRNFDCRWSILFKNATGEVISELNLDGLLGVGEFNGRSCLVAKPLWDRLHVLAKAVDPHDDPPPDFSPSDKAPQSLGD